MSSDRLLSGENVTHLNHFCSQVGSGQERTEPDISGIFASEWFVDDWRAIEEFHHGNEAWLQGGAKRTAIKFTFIIVWFCGERFPYDLVVASPFFGWSMRRLAFIIVDQSAFGYIVRMSETSLIEFPFLTARFSCK